MPKQIESFRRGTPAAHIEAKIMVNHLMEKQSSLIMYATSLMQTMERTPYLGTTEAKTLVLTVIEKMEAANQAAIKLREKVVLGG